MREILFRGKRFDNGEWIYWNIYGEICRESGKRTRIAISNNNGESYYYYIHQIKRLIDTSTVGQFTGLTANGKKIFEGDMFHLDDEIIAVVIFKDGCFRLEEYGLCGAWTESGFDECGGGWGVIECNPIDWYYVRDMEVIGNIHDNKLEDFENGC